MNLEGRWRGACVQKKTIWCIEALFCHEIIDTPVVIMNVEGSLEGCLCLPVWFIGVVFCYAIIDTPVVIMNVEGSLEVVVSQNAPGWLSGIGRRMWGGLCPVWGIGG